MIKLSENIYGFHDIDCQHLILDNKSTGYITVTTELGHDPNNHNSQQFNTYNDRITYIVRLNNGYGRSGTIPLKEKYVDFAQRCANFVKHTNAEIFIVSNEISLEWEYPNNIPITLDDYIECYLLCYDKIKQVKPNSLIMPYAVATWNVTLKYPGNENGDWCKQQLDLLNRIGNKVDAIAIHAYSHIHSTTGIYSEEKMQSFPDKHYHFKSYQDLMNAIPNHLKHLPVFLTETNADVVWKNENNGFVQALYSEINWWNNTPNNQQILCACLYRCKCKYDSIDRGIECVDGVQQDFIEAVKKQFAHNYSFSSAYTLPKLPSNDILIPSTHIVELDEFSKWRLNVTWYKLKSDIDKAVNIRSKPTTASEIVTKIIPNSTCRILSTIGEEIANDNYTWISVYVITNDELHIGYIAKNFVDVIVG